MPAPYCFPSLCTRLRPAAALAAAADLGPLGAAPELLPLAAAADPPLLAPVAAAAAAFLLAPLLSCCTYSATPPSKKWMPPSATRNTRLQDSWMRYCRQEWGGGGEV